MSLVAVTVHSVGLDPATNSPLVILKESGGERSLPIWIGSAEALAINLALDSVSLERPLTHDLIKSLLDSLDTALERAVINEIKGGTYFAQLILRSGDRLLAVDARPSDSIAIALRTRSPIYVDEAVLESHGLAVPDKEDPDDLAERLKRIKPEEFGRFTL